MRDRDALMRAVIDQPDDDGPRLVLSDWFEENGDPRRAEFIRVQIELARVGAGDRPRLEKLAARERELYAARTPDWYEGVPKWALEQVANRHGTRESRKSSRGCKVVFRRGFLSALICAPAEWLGAGPLARSIPLESLYINESDAERLARVAEAPHLAGVTALLVGIDAPGSVPALLGSPHLANLRWLAFDHANQSWSSKAGDAVVAQLAQMPGLAGLEGLWLSFMEIQRAALRALARSRYLTRLRALDLGFNILGDAGVARLVSSPVVANLTSLQLHNGRFGTPAALAVAASPHLARLEHLDLGWNQIGTEGAEALAASPHLSRLTYLNLRQNPIGDAGARALVRSPHLANLRRLDLGSTGLTAPGVAALGAESGLPRLEHLGLWPGWYEPAPEVEAAARALIGSLNFPRLRDVTFHQEEVAAFGMGEMKARFSPLHGEALLGQCRNIRQGTG
jgi:uncharacterized protein (TIGR02996 family)